MKIFKLLKKKDVGSIGIGAMIVFIAMVLVAGIAASVLVQTANKLETQAMVTGSETTSEVATGLRVIDIEGYKTTLNMAYNKSNNLHWNISGRGDGNTSNRGWHNYTRIHRLAITLAPRAGSMDVDLSETIVEISNSTTKVILTYNSNYYEHMVGDNGVFSTNCFDLAPDHFGIIELEDVDGSVSASTPVINRGDKVMLTVNVSACFWGFPERTDIWGQVIPEDGSPGIFAFRTPAAFTDTTYDLY